jgi:hypothetical protein
MDLKEKISKAIKDSMPEQVGKELRQLLTEAEQAKTELVYAKEANKKAVSKIASLESTIKEMTDELSLHEELTIRENEISKRERHAAIIELTTKLEESEKRADMVQAFTSSLVRNTIVRKSILDNYSEDQPGYSDANGNWIQPTPKHINKNYKEEKTEE